MSMPVARASATFTDEPELFSPPPKPPVRKLEKAPNAFRTISEVGEDLNVPQHVLRFWETKFTQLRPLKRGGGRRYYRTEDVVLLRQIHGLLYGQGYTIKGAQKVLKERSPARDNVVDTLSKPVQAADSIAPAIPPMTAAGLTLDETRVVLSEMLAELKALRALV